MSKLTIKETGFDGLYIINTNAYVDSRGTFARWFCSEELKDILGNQQVVNVNYSMTTKKGSIRGLHYQNPPCTETKMIRCIRGKILDVVVDIRKDSPTFLKYCAVELSPENMSLFYIPKGFAHSFQSLEDNCETMYLVTSHYSAEKESGINPFDKRVGIKWPLPISDVSDKDRNRPFLDDNFDGIIV